MRQSRAPTPDDLEHLDAKLAKFRNEFKCWEGMFSNDWELLDFVLYEGIRLPIVEEAAPLILGEKCVATHGARWCMLKVGSDWFFAIDHDELAEPVDLTNFRRKDLKRKLSQKWQRLLDPSRPAY